jgi:hypothetical protein
MLHLSCHLYGHGGFSPGPRGNPLPPGPRGNPLPPLVPPLPPLVPVGTPCSPGPRGNPPASLVPMLPLVGAALRGNPPPVIDRTILTTHSRPIFTTLASPSPFSQSTEPIAVPPRPRPQRPAGSPLNLQISPIKPAGRFLVQSSVSHGPRGSRLPSSPLMKRHPAIIAGRPLSSHLVPMLCVGTPPVSEQAPASEAASPLCAPRHLPRSPVSP